MRHVVVTGGAGFIGGAIISRLLASGAMVTIYDNLSSATTDWADPFARHLGAPSGSTPRLHFRHGDILDLAALTETIDAATDVIHLAANTDIAGGFADPRLDLEGCVLGTWNVAEAMRRTGVRRLMFASSGVVYGQPSCTPTAETYGPMRPASHYAAGKLAGEAIISGFAHLYGWRTLVFRFGNTVGARSDHGVVHDFVVKLLRDPSRLEMLGDGRQAKPYIAVDDVAGAVLHVDRTAPDSPYGVFNVASGGTVTVRRVAELVADAMGLDPTAVRIEALGGDGGWHGDTPLVDFATAAIRELGWRPTLTGEGAVTAAALGTRARLTALGGPLETALERRVKPIAVEAR